MEIKTMEFGKEKALGFVRIEDIINGDEIIYISSKCPEEDEDRVLIHEHAHIIQLRNQPKKELLFLLDNFNKIDFHDKQFYRILNKLEVSC